MICVLFLESGLLLGPTQSVDASAPCHTVAGVYEPEALVLVYSQSVPFAVMAFVAFSLKLVGNITVAVSSRHVMPLSNDL